MKDTLNLVRELSNEAQRAREKEDPNLAFLLDNAVYTIVSQMRLLTELSLKLQILQAELGKLNLEKRL